MKLDIHCRISEFDYLSNKDVSRRYAYLKVRSSSAKIFTEDDGISSSDDDRLLRRIFKKRNSQARPCNIRSLVTSVLYGLDSWTIDLEGRTKNRSASVSLSGQDYPMMA